jgi:glucan phosphoethanolaminetransferase (alkaline phosphatase superfamily)
VSSKCPNCGEKNTTPAGYLAMISIIVALVIFLVLIAGSISWAYYSFKNKLSKWHCIGSLLLGAVSIFVLYYYFYDTEYPIIRTIAYVLNSIGVLLSLYQLSKSTENENEY